MSKVVIEKAHNSVWFSVDRRGKKWSPYLTDTNGFQKRCDYVILNESGRKVKMIFVELKSLNVTKQKLIEKFRATECFMDYCESISKRFFCRSILSSCEKRFVVFYLAPSLAKTPTRPQSSSHNEAEHAKFIANPRKTKLRELL